MIRIAIAKDHAMVGDTLAASIATERDLDVPVAVPDDSAALAAVAQHLTVAQAMRLTEGTVKNPTTTIHSKPGAANRGEAAARARALGWQ